MIRSGNPTLNDKAFRGVRTVPGVDSMTLGGTVNKTIFALLLTIGAASYSWSNPGLAKFYLPLVIGTLVVGLVVTFKKNTAPYLTPVYAIAQGLMLGSISLFAETRYPGIVFQAVGLTFGTMFALLGAYRTGWIKATENFKLGVAAATGGIFFFYLITLVLNLFGVSTSFLSNSSPLSIGISFVVVIIAALNLVMDFDFIENASASGNTPKYMEWYGAFGLLVTLIWLYVEILRLLMKLAERK